MHLYLLRHGIAEPVAPSGDDAARRLTQEGIRRLRHQVAALRRAGLWMDHALTSPLERARQTATLVAHALSADVEEVEALRPGCELADLAKVVRRLAWAEHLLVVGHQPDLGRLVEVLTGARVRMRTGMLACIEADRLRPGTGVLVGLYDPDVMVQLGAR